MLDFAVRHKIKPLIERFPLTKAGVEEGMAKLREGKMRYRGVLVAQRAHL
jgi:D-arabinose 1-dehydrogenase-like Zn-dependent alcohol dehydrogenase